MRILESILMLAVSFTLLSGCDALIGKEVARLSINQISTDGNDLIIKEASLDLKKGEKIAIWSEMDIQYEGDVALRFKMNILKNGEYFVGLEIDPTDKNITIGEIKTSLMGKTDWEFTGKNAEVEIEEDGSYTFRGLLVASENPTLEVTSAIIVLKK